MKNVTLSKVCLMEEKLLIPAETQRVECCSGRKDTARCFLYMRTVAFGRANGFSDGKLDNNSVVHLLKGLHSSVIAEYLLSNSRLKYKRICKCKNKQCKFS